MNLFKPLFSIILLLSALFSCNNNSNIFNNTPAINDGCVNAIIEISSGEIEKWELNKKSGEIERDSIDGLPRTINYLGYPANYGMVPQTILPKEKGGDGDPLDIIVIGEPVLKGEIIKCKIIGVLKLLDRNEKDDKLIAIAENSSLSSINSMEELNEKNNGISKILEIWFSNYKGSNKVISQGYGDQKEALIILNASIKEYKALIK
jgi:inorganic pyrophosphatase